MKGHRGGGGGKRKNSPLLKSFNRAFDKCSRQLAGEEVNLSEEEEEALSKAISLWDKGPGLRMQRAKQEWHMKHCGWYRRWRKERTWPGRPTD